MLTKEQRDAIRARCEAATPGPWEQIGIALHCLCAGLMGRMSLLRKIDRFFQNTKFITRDIHAQLDALDEMEEALSAMTRRAEVLERVIKENEPCFACCFWNNGAGQMMCEHCAEAEDFDDWKFDEVRFAGKEVEDKC